MTNQGHNAAPEHSMTPPPISAEFIAQAKSHIRAVIERDRAERSIGGRRRWPKRISKPRLPAKTDAERAKAYRDRKRMEKNAAAARAYRADIEVDAVLRCAFLEDVLLKRQLPHKLRHLRGREWELSLVWMVREIVRNEPKWTGRQGPPASMSRMMELFEAHYRVPVTTDPGAAMRRRLKLVRYLEETGIWPSYPSAGARLPTS